MSRKRAVGLSEEEKNIQMWKMKKLISTLDDARGNGTSMISLIIKPKTQVSAVSRMLAEEYGKASNIKSRVNRLSVLDAVTSTQQRLKLYSRIPDNGLVIFCGTVNVGDNKTKKMTMDFEPYKAINTTLYLCDSTFHTEPLRELLTSNETFGFVVMDGGGCLFATLSGNTRTTLHKFHVSLPKKHGRGGQSALRFARLRLEKRRNYLRKVAELSTQYYLSNERPNVKGLILAGSADFKSELRKSDLFDARLRAVVLKVVDVAYGGETGFSKAIELSQECLANVKYIREKKIIDRFFENIAKDTRLYVFGVKNTLQALDMGVIDTLILWENLDVERYAIAQEEGEKVVHLTEEQRAECPDFKSGDGSVEYNFEQMPLLEWLCENYTKIGCHLELISDRSEQGSQFVKGFGGIGAILRYQLDFSLMNAVEEEELDGEDVDLDAFI